MTSRHPQDVASACPRRDLDDLIAGHLDGGLDPREQRRLAALLDGSPSARETLARYLRLEAGLIRLASTTGGGGGRMHAAVAVMPRTEDRVGWVRRGSQAGGAVVAGGLAAAALVVMMLGGMGVNLPRSGDVALVADRWLELSTADASRPPASLAIAEGGPRDDVHAEPGGLEPSDDDPLWSSGSPPAWLVVAVADKRAQQSAPDER